MVMSWEGKQERATGGVLCRLWIGYERFVKISERGCVMMGVCGGWFPAWILR